MCPTALEAKMSSSVNDVEEMKRVTAGMLNKPN